MSQQWRIIDLITWAETYFKDKGFENKYAITATKPDIESHKNALAIGSSSSTTLNLIKPSWSHLSFKF